MVEQLNPQGGYLLQGKKVSPLSSKKWAVDIFEPLIDSIEVGVYVLDLSGTIKRVNRFILEQYEWEADELVGKNIFELLPDLSDMGLERKFKQVIREGRTKELTNLRRKDHLGHDVVFNLKGIPIIEGNEIKGILAVMNDITEKRALESQVAETEEYLRSLIDNANDMIYTLDSEGYITFLNRMGQEITGYKFDPGDKGHYSEYVTKKDLTKNATHFSEALKGKPQRYESTIVGIDGRLVKALINLTPIHKDEKVVGVLGIAHDITQRKQMEAQLLQASKIAAIGELAAGVAHEINNPAAIISGTAEQIQFLIDHCRERPEEIAERLSKHVETIREQAARCKKITQGLLNFARKTEIHTAEVNVTRLLEETVALVENRARSEGKKIETHLSADLPGLTADPHQLEQVFLNLVNNALDAVDSNGAVTINAWTENNSFAIEFSDDGVGIAEEDLDKIFDPFFTTKPVGKGTGLGLSICFGMVQRMNGTISVSSKPGVGTIFTVRLPLKRQKSPK
ncbi:MAG: PAS domain S-box protein [Candidatus Hydrogenedentota bacterium]|nr:MAG: PAS domain S-box protein [Candidatus Hydrogenedentota bacterium]